MTLKHLNGIKVLEFTQTVMGPTAGLILEELGIATGVDLDQLIEVGRLAEDIVGHQLPGELIHAGSLDAFRRERLQ